ncbi:MAG: hypothetical protein EA391_07985 [Balneolaceae bacterium]|nr:MAG: hypothetical protein EA391_07985 [Balneolaceae bacterium]
MAGLCCFFFFTTFWDGGSPITIGSGVITEPPETTQPLTSTEKLRIVRINTNLFLSPVLKMENI